MDAANVSAAVESALPAGGRPRQLSVRTLLVGMLSAQADDRPGHMVRVHRALLSLSAPDQRRLGVVVDWRGGPHTLTYRQVERTFGLVLDALGANAPAGGPTDTLAGVVERSSPKSSFIFTEGCDGERPFVRPAADR